MHDATRTLAKGITKPRGDPRRSSRTFSSNGYDRTSVREIARASGLSQAGLLHYFANKEELFTEVLQETATSATSSSTTHSTVSRSPPTDSSRSSGTTPTSQTSSGCTSPCLPKALTSTATPDHSSCRATPHCEPRSPTGCDSYKKDDAFTSTIEADVVASLLIATADGLQTQWLLDPDSVDMGQRIGELWICLQRIA